VDMVNITRKLWAASAPLTAAGLLMAAAFLASAAGIFLDHRIITGVPAWLKPTKFAISTAIFALTTAWLFTYIDVWPRFVRALGWTLSIVAVLEVALIDVQAARGTTSHFNFSTPLDGVLFGIMGVAIAILLLASIGVTAALFRQHFDQPAWGWSLRLGMLITVIGSAGGGLMVRPTPAQADSLRVNHSITVLGGHTVGGPDGGPGLPGVGWSTQHGDLRIPHFFGLHGVQVIAFLGWLISRRHTERASRQQVGLVFTSAASYLACIAILGWQALRGQSAIEPDSATLTAMLIWLGATMTAVAWLWSAPMRERTVSNATAPLRG
jgi:hypothetical protein